MAAGAAMRWPPTVRASPLKKYRWRRVPLPAAAGRWTPVEIKSGQTLCGDWVNALHKWQALADDLAAEPLLVYAGDRPASWHGVRAVPWNQLRAT